MLNTDMSDATDPICPYCGESFYVDVFDAWDDRSFILETCCETAYEAIVDDWNSYAILFQEMAGRGAKLQRALKALDREIGRHERELVTLQDLPPILAEVERGKSGFLEKRLHALRQQREVVARELKGLRKELYDQHAQARETWQEIFLRAGLEIRQVIINPDGCDSWIIDWGLSVRPIEQQTAKEFIRRYHRHNPPPAGWLFGLGCYNGPDLVAVAWVGRPVSRVLDREGERVEVNRLCVNPELDPGLTWNACSLLYAECAKRARGLHNKRGQPYRIIQTYTLESELGTSLIAAGWTPVYKNKGGSWDRPSRRRTNSLPTESKIRWEKILR